MVKQVEELRPELKTDSLGDRCALEHCEIPVIDSGGPEGGIRARFGTETPIRRRREAGCVKPLGNVSSTCRFTAGWHDVRAHVGDTKVGGFQGGRGASTCNLQRESALEGRLAVDPPTGNQFVRHSRQASRESLAMTEGEIEDIADNQPLRNNLKGERSLSSQDVSQRLVISYVLDLPFGHGKRFAAGLTGVANKLVSGWGIDGETAFQRGFPLKITWAGTPTPLEAANLGVSNVRPDVVPGCSKSAGGGHVAQWFNTSCFAPPPDWGFGTESRADSTLRTPGVNNWDFAVFKRTTITERVGFGVRT